MKGLVSAVAAGKCNDKVILDLMQEEDNYGNADLPIGLNHTTGEIVLLQMDGHLSPAQFDEALDLAVEGNKQVVKFQREALERRFATTAGDMDAKIAAHEDRLDQNARDAERAKQRESERGGERRGPPRGGSRDGGRGGDRGGDRRGPPRGGDRDGGRGRDGDRRGGSRDGGDRRSSRGGDS
jgi:hypothetical protein